MSNDDSPLGVFLVWLLVIVGLLFYINSEAEMLVKVQPPASPSDRSSERLVTGFVDNDDGSKTLIVDACGTTILITGSLQDHIRLSDGFPPKEVLKLRKIVETACKEPSI